MTNVEHEVATRDEPLLARLEALRELGGDAALRRFALWCAETVAADADHSGSLSAQLVKLRGAIGDDAALARLHEETRGAACATGTIGVRQNPGYAFAQLTVYAAAIPDALRAALSASHNARDHYRMRSQGEQRPRARAAARAPGSAPTLGETLDALGNEQRESLEALGASLALRAQAEELDRRIGALRAA